MPHLTVRAAPAIKGTSPPELHCPPVFWLPCALPPQGPSQRQSVRLPCAGRPAFSPNTTHSPAWVLGGLERRFYAGSVASLVPPGAPGGSCDPERAQTCQAPRCCLASAAPATRSVRLRSRAKPYDLRHLRASLMTTQSHAGAGGKRSLNHQAVRRAQGPPYPPASPPQPTPLGGPGTAPSSLGLNASQA